MLGWRRWRLHTHVVLCHRLVDRRLRCLRLLELRRRLLLLWRRLLPHELRELRRRRATERRSVGRRSLRAVSLELRCEHPRTVELLGEPCGRVREELHIEADLWRPDHRLREGVALSLDLQFLS